MDMKSRPVALITGATKNTGFATATRFAKEGYDVCVTSRDKKEAQAAAKKIMKMYPEISAKGYGVQTYDVQQIREAFQDVKERFGRLDVMVANATATGFHSLVSTTPEQFDFVMDCNAKGYFFCCQEAAKIMIPQKSGAMVLIGSVHSHGAIPKRITYAASKGAIDVISRNAAYELGKYGIRCNCIVAGAIWNNKWEGMSQEELQKRRDNWPLAIESVPENIANAVFFLASDQAATITGSELVVDSGVSACVLQYDKNWEES